MTSYPQTEKWVQSWTRCKLPIDTPLPAVVQKDYLDQLPDIWHVPLSGLMNAPGYLDSSCGRNIKNLEEVLFIAEWKDGDSLKAFLETSAYAQYLQAFGIHDSQTPGALISVVPCYGVPAFNICTFEPGARVTTFTFSFPYPASEENRRALRDVKGLSVSMLLSKLGARCLHAWIAEPQIGSQGQLVERGLAIQPWPRRLGPAFHEAVDKDERSRDILRGQVKDMNPLHMEEETWEIAMCKLQEEELQEEEEWRIEVARRGGLEG